MTQSIFKKEEFFFFLFIQKKELIVRSDIITPFSMMEERRTARSILILCFVIGMLVGQSTAKTNWDECFDSCQKNCFNSLNGNASGMLGCIKCDNYCRRMINGEACFLFWCWKVKNRGWKLYFPPFWYWWGLRLLVETLQAIRSSHHLRRVLILIKVNKSNEENFMK